ncbi:ABC transporter permease [Vallitalea sp.]|jgi:ABC-2 type transport system permease protein|uniref:ABC transporter permease n=1 Tax=Vallitalea sp. TaxID=1882829 RepID=UPI0025DE0CFF|nr:ABC transporter permease [Vallitalea sp.]MCT4688791.1 ABC transporter permease [Vallitalea sp.]
MFAVLKVKILGYKNDSPILLSFIAMMLIFTYIFGASFSTKSVKPTVYIVDNAENNISELLITKLQESKVLKLKEVKYDKAVDSVKRSKGIGAIVVEEGTQGIKLSVMSINKTRDTIMLKRLLSGISNIFQNDMKLADITYKYLNKSGIAVEKNKIQKEIMEEMGELRDKKAFYKTSSEFIDTDLYSYDNLKQALAGFALFFSMFLVFFGIGNIVDEKKHYVWQRQLVSPLKNISILSGNVIATFIAGFVNILVMVYGGKYLFHIDWGKSDIGVLLLLGAFIFTITCLGLFISSFFKTRQQLSSIVPVITVSTSMLGGCMWPLEIIQSKTLLFIANLTPQKWALEGIKDLIMYGHGIESIVTPVLVLLLMGIIYLALGIRFVNASK